MNTKSTVKYLIVIGFIIGAGLGLGGSMSTPGSTMQKVVWEISSLGLIMASILYARTSPMSGDVLASSGLVILAIAEAVMSGGTLLGESGSQATFGAGMALYGPALILIAVSSYFALWIRGAAALSAIAFLIGAMKIFTGEVTPSSSMFPSAGYMLMTLATIGWIWTVMKKSQA